MLIGYINSAQVYVAQIALTPPPPTPPTLKMSMQNLNNLV